MLKIFSTEWLTKLIGTTEFSSKTKTKWQRRNLTTNITTNTTDISDLRFSNLEIGKTYKLSMSISIINGDASGQVQAIHNGNGILTVSTKTTALGNNDRIVCGSSVVFTATATSLTFNYTEFDASAQLDGNDQTFTLLEELPNHELTSQWI